MPHHFGILLEKSEFSLLDAKFAFMFRLRSMFIATGLQTAMYILHVEPVNALYFML